jgi:hypothetical protein
MSETSRMGLSSKLVAGVPVIFASMLLTLALGELAIG